MPRRFAPPWTVETIDANGCLLSPMTMAYKAIMVTDTSTSISIGITCVVCLLRLVAPGCSAAGLVTYRLVLDLLFLVNAPKPQEHWSNTKAPELTARISL